MADFTPDTDADRTAALAVLSRGPHPDHRIVGAALRLPYPDAHRLCERLRAAGLVRSSVLAGHKRYALTDRGRTWLTTHLPPAAARDAEHPDPLDSPHAPDPTEETPAHV